MEKLFFTLESCDYRVHISITRALASTVNGDGCPVCVQNAALQLVFCHAIGFGIDHGIDKNAEYLARSGSTIVQVEEALQRIKNDDKRSDVIMANLAQRGYHHDFPTIYARDGVLSDAIDYYRRAVAKRKTLFDPAHFSTLRLQGILLSLLREDDRFEEAVEMALEMDEVASGLNVVDQIEIKQNLALLHASLGDLEKAEEWANAVSKMYADLPEGEKTTESLDNQQHLARILLQQGRFDDAISLAKLTLEDCQEELGDLHSSTIGVQRCLAQAYRASGQIKLAVETNKTLVSVEERLLTRSNIDPKLVEDISILGVQCYWANEIDTARQCYEKVHGLIKRDKAMAKHAVQAINNCATELIRQGDEKKAFVILDALLPETSSVLGPHSWEAALVMGNLAWLYTQDGIYDRAEEFERQVVKVRQETLGPSHQHTITALGHLRLTFLAQCKHDDAARVGEKGLEAVAGRENASISGIINAAETIATSLASAGAFSQALPFFESEMRLTDADVNGISLTSLASMARTARCYLHLEKAGQAKEMTIAMLSRVPKVSSVDPEDLARQSLALAKEFLERECFPESEQLLVLALLLSQQSSSMPEALVADTRSTVKNYLDRRKLDALEVTFDPSKLLP